MTERAARTLLRTWARSMVRNVRPDMTDGDLRELVLSWFTGEALRVPSRQRYAVRQLRLVAEQLAHEEEV